MKRKFISATPDSIPYSDRKLHREMEGQHKRLPMHIIVRIQQLDCAGLKPFEISKVLEEEMATRLEPDQIVRVLDPPEVKKRQEYTGRVALKTKDRR